MKTKKIINNFSIIKNSVVDKGDGIIEFSKPLIITDTSDQRNGTKYDIPSMDISEYDNGLTADHSSSIEDIIGNTFGIKKDDKKVTIDGIKFAVKENAKAIFVYNMILGGFIKDFSIETLGPWADNEGVYYNSKLIGLSVVTKGNNKSATLSKITKNSIDEAEKNGLSTDSLKKELHIDNSSKLCHKYIMKIKVTNNRNFNITINYAKKNGEKVEKELAPNSFIMVAKDYQAEVEAQINNAVEPQKNSLEDAVKNAVAPLMGKIADLEKKFETNSAKEPQFQINKAEEGELMSMDYQDRTGKQVLYAWNALKNGNSGDFTKLREINSLHLEALKKAGLAKNSMTIADFGNFVMSPELIKEIEGVRSNYQPLLSQLNFKDTLSLQMAWLNRSGDISMEEVDMCDDGADGNLKPIKEYSAEIKTSNLQELAAVTPVCNSATRFLAADLLGDVAEGYRNDFDRKKAQLFIARLQQAIDTTGNVAVYNTTTDLKSLKSWVEMMKKISGKISNGTFILSESSKLELLNTVLGSGVSGNVLGVAIDGQLNTILGHPIITVPDDLLPTLNTAETKTFTIEGVSVSITHAIFYVELSTFVGRTSGGLQYDLSTDAAYEDSEGNVKSAYQRNELVLRGSFFRGGAIKNTEKVAALGSRGVS